MNKSIKDSLQSVKDTGLHLKIHTISLGCARNQVDSEAMAYLIQKQGWSFSSSKEDADVIIINTCAFIEEAKKESIDCILDALSTKNKTRALVVVTGCFSQRYARSIKDDLSEVDLFIGVDEYPRIVELIREKFLNKTQSDLENRIYIQRRPSLYKDPIYKINTLSLKSSYVKIAEGCKHRCAFCAIPIIRGSLKSVPQEYIVEQVKSLQKQGVVEINLIAQDLAGYGQDLGKDAGSQINLYTLLEKLSEIEGIWIRLLYYYPEYIDSRLIGAFDKYPNLIRYLDIPVQHISDRVLRRMNRQISSSKLKETLYRLKTNVQGLSLRTSCLVGFPGETKKDVEELLEFVKEGWFDNLGCFAYSREENTPAYNFSDQIEEKEKQNRVAIIMEAQKEVSKRKMKERIGTSLNVLVESRDNPDHFEEITYTGRAYFQAPEVDGCVYVKDSAQNKIKEPGIYKVKIIDATEYDLEARFLD